ncbi:unnamed protein product [Phytophthora lilii]|uniref:Unnamed protein product n=1 Tax=Phytophthora lilii TaxID=2077276 RepID=A0A9W7D7S8_9STRA|nr:unnamed protein product [Phytophthora lilii]
MNNPELFMRKCIGMDVSVRVKSGETGQGVLHDVKDNGNVVLKPAQELLYGKEDGSKLPEKELTKRDMLWLRRSPTRTDAQVGDPEPGPAPTERRWSPDTKLSAEGCRKPKLESAVLEATRTYRTCRAKMPTNFTFCSKCSNHLLDETKQEQQTTSLLKVDVVCCECSWPVVQTEAFRRRCGHFLPTAAAFA